MTLIFIAMESHDVHLAGMPPGRFKLGSCWGLGNELVVFPAPETRTGNTGLRPANVHLQNVKWETTVYEPVFRKLVNESLHVFLNLQKVSKEDEGNLIFASS